MNLQKLDNKVINETEKISEKLVELGYVLNQYNFVVVTGEHYKEALKYAGVKIAPKTKFEEKNVFWVS